MSFWVYILECSDGSFYTGHTENLDNRIAEHKVAETKSYTSTRLPITLVYSEFFETREEAIESERQIKGWSRKKKQALIMKNWDRISELAKKDFSNAE